MGAKSNAGVALDAVAASDAAIAPDAIDAVDQPFRSIEDDHVVRVVRTMDSLRGRLPSIESRSEEHTSELQSQA